MKTERLSEAALEKTDAEAVLRHAFHGEPLDPEIARRVHVRAQKITEEIYRVHGLVDDETFQKILDDEEI
jgi:hypothetical protein